MCVAAHHHIVSSSSCLAPAALFIYLFASGYKVLGFERPVLSLTATTIGLTHQASVVGRTRSSIFLEAYELLQSQA